MTEDTHTDMSRSRWFARLGWWFALFWMLSCLGLLSMGVKYAGFPLTHTLWSLWWDVAWFGVCGLICFFADWAVLD